MVGYDAPNPDAKIVHFTKGIPVWPETQDCEFAGDWHEMLSDSLATVSHEELMGRFVTVVSFLMVINIGYVHGGCIRTWRGTSTHSAKPWK